MSKSNTILSFDEVTYEYDAKKRIMTEASFSVRRGAKMTLMGQNGAGKSTLFGLITGTRSPDEGQINLDPKATIALSRQVIPRDELSLTMREFFAKCFSETIYNLDPKIDEVLEIVAMPLPDYETYPEQKDLFKDRVISSFSGGQQARLLLASALIQKPDILLLDEPTNNLDTAGIEHLTDFIKRYPKTVLVISHDADFLNSFTQGVLYLNVQTKKVERYEGNYDDVLEEIGLQVDKETKKNAQLRKQIQANKDKSNQFANKGGNMRLVARKMRDRAEAAEASMVDVRKDDKTIRPFTIPVHESVPLNVLELTSYTVIKNHMPTEVPANITLQRGKHLRLIGPNGIGKTTLLESLASGNASGEEIADGVLVGYYRQDFSNLDFDQTVLDCLLQAASDSHKRRTEQEVRSTAASFLITGNMAYAKIGLLSEGQKGLVAFARLVLLEPGLLILDEPTNHINFRHIPMIAKALDQYEGAMILVSHVEEFVDQIRIDDTLDLGKEPVKSKKPVKGGE